VLKKVLPPDDRSIVEVSKETDINYQVIKNWVKRSESGVLCSFAALVSVSE
jgi:transposase